MRSFFFGASRKLYGALHEPAGEARPAGVLLCYPGPQEYNMTHWAFRKLAGLLTREGFTVMRFDYSCTGDSDGDGHDASLERQVEDVATAAEELKDAAGLRRIAVIGMRLGAVLAARAVEGGLKVSDLVLWEPIFRGADYVAELEKLDDAECSRLQHRVTLPRVELAGFPFPSAMRQALEQIDLRAVTPKAAARVALFLTAPSPEATDLEAHWQRSGLKVSTQVVHEEGGVTAGGARDSAVLYSEMLTAMAAGLKGAKAGVAA